LYGRNAVGGALNLISKAPANQVEATARFTAGTFGEWRAEARVGGPLKRDRVLGSIAFVRGVRNGYVRDLQHPGEPLGADDLTAARGQMRIVFGRAADLLVAADISDQDGTPLTYNKVLEVKPGFQVDNPPALHDVRTSMRALAPMQQHGTSARLTLALDPSATLVSLTAFRGLDNEFLVDADVTELNVFSAHSRERQHQWSEEVTLTYRRPRLTALAGVFLFDETDRQAIHADQPEARVRTVLDPRVAAGSVAVFGQSTFRVIPKVSGTVGLRYTRERKRIDNAGGRYTLGSDVTLLPGSGYQYSDSILHTAWTPKFGVDVTLPGRATAYVTATNGFKSGGFNISAARPNGGFGPEWAWSYEGGVKTTLLEGRARLNVAVFEMDYTDLQVQTPVGLGVFDVRNAAAATIRGIEVEGAARLRGDLEAGGHLTWLDARYDRYIAVGIGGLVGDVAGNRLTNAPEWAGRLWAEWTASLGASRLVLAVDATAQSTVFYTPFNDTIQTQSSYALVGARGEYGPGDGRWAVNAYARNLTNAGYIMAAFATSPVAYGGRPGTPRQAGIQLVLRR
jgi:iron complex outermembrane receptor protein